VLACRALICDAVGHAGHECEGPVWEPADVHDSDQHVADDADPGGAADSGASGFVLLLLRSGSELQGKYFSRSA
jgi:hypothetical protein